jgi:hypothetical protein
LVSYAFIPEHVAATREYISQVDLTASSQPDYGLTIKQFDVRTGVGGRARHLLPPQTFADLRVTRVNIEQSQLNEQFRLTHRP